MDYLPREPREDVNVTPTHPLKDAVTLVVGFVALVFVVVSLATVLAESLIVHIPPSWEARLFGGVWGGDDVGETSDPRQEALDSLLARLVVHWPDAAYPFTIRVVEDADVNAFAVPGGQILVTSALLEGARSENEVAFVVGHELGHFRNRDHLRGLSRGLVVGAALSAIGAGSLGIPDFAVQLGERRFSRKQESQADRFGLSLIHAEYDHVGHAGTFFQRLPAPSSRLGRTVHSYLSTHPVSDARMEEIDAMAEEYGWRREGEATPLPAEFTSQKQE